MEINKIDSKTINILCLLVLFLFGIIAFVNSMSDGIVRLTNVELIKSEGSQYVSLEFNFPVRDIITKTEVNNINNGLGWVGEVKQELDFLGNNILEVLIYDIGIAKKLRDMEKKIISGNLGFVSLNSDIKYMITFPPDDALTAIYIGSNNSNFDKILFRNLIYENKLIIKLD